MVIKKKNGFFGEKEFFSFEGDNYFNDLFQKYCILLFVQIIVFYLYEYNFFFKI